MSGFSRSCTPCLQTRLKESEITQAMEDPTVRIVDPAVVPDRPVQPVPTINLALSLLLGSLMGIGITLGRELTDRRVRTRADALLASGLPSSAPFRRRDDSGGICCPGKQAA